MRLTKVLFWLAQLVGVAATIWLLWQSDLPLGVPSEWVWDRIQYTDASLKETSFGWVIAGVMTLIYLVFCFLAGRRVLDANRWEMTGWLLALILAGTTWHGVVQECPPDPHRLSKVGWVLWFHGFQGYYEEARGRATEEPDYLAKYADRMREGDVLHFGTHPPGFILLHKSIIGFVSRSPRVQGWLLKFQPDSVRASLDILVSLSSESRTPLTDVDRAALWLSGLLAAVAAMSTVVPLFFLVRLTCDRETAWRIACLWPMVPALAVFHPVTDLWLPFFATSFLSLWGQAWLHRSWWIALLAGAVMSLGMRLSLAMLPVAFLAASWTLGDFLFAKSTESPQARMKELAICVVAALSSFGLFTFWVGWTSSLNLPEVWLQNFRNHAGFYAKFSRSYWSWLLINPFELALAIGTPIFIFAASSWLTSTKGCLGSKHSLASFRLWCFVTLIVLLLTGKNSGEAARLWIFLMPWLLWISGREAEIAAKIVNGPGQTLPEFTGTPARGWLALMVLQAIVCIATVSRVDGFHFKTLVPIPESTVENPASGGHDFLTTSG